MATAVFTTRPPFWPPSWIFQKILIFAKLQQILLELVENMCF